MTQTKLSTAEIIAIIARNPQGITNAGVAAALGREPTTTLSSKLCKLYAYGLVARTRERGGLPAVYFPKAPNV